MTWLTSKVFLNAIDIAPDTAPSAATEPRTVVLLHGMMGSSESWARVTNELVGLGHRVLALDLPGHGLSPRDSNLTIESAATSVVQTVGHLAPGERAIAMGHSYGATVLAEAADALRPALAIYIDAALRLQGGHDHAALTAQYETARRERLSVDGIRASRPHYPADAAAIEARAAHRFDPATTAAISCHSDRSWTPGPGSILVHAEPSRWVSSTDIESHRQHGVDVRGLPGAEHTVWYGHFAEFMSALPELFGRCDTPTG